MTSDDAHPSQIDAARRRILAFLTSVGVNDVPPIDVPVPHHRHLTLACEIDGLMWIFGFERGESLSFSGDGDLYDSIGVEEIVDLLSPPGEDELQRRADAELEAFAYPPHRLEDLVTITRSHRSKLRDLLGGSKMAAARAEFHRQRVRLNEIIAEKVAARIGNG